MKKKIALLLAIAAAFMVSGCGNENAETEKISYTIERHDSSIVDEAGYGLERYYDLFQLNSDSDDCKETNAAFNELYDKFSQESENTDFDMFAKEAQSREALYINTLEAQVREENDEYISLLHTSRWYMGGVYNENYDGFVISAQTGKEMTLPELLGQSQETLLPEIKDTVLTYMSKVELADSNMENVVAGLEINDVDFYVENGTVYLLFDTYVLAAGAAGPMVIPFRDLAHENQAGDQPDSEKEDGGAPIGKDDITYAAELIGKTVGDFKAIYGEDYITDYYGGGSFVQSETGAPAYFLGWATDVTR